MTKFSLLILTIFSSWEVFSQRDLFPSNLLTNTTIRIVGYRDTVFGGVRKEVFNVGTGFFYEFQFDSITFMSIVTNKHVIERSTGGTLTFEEQKKTVLGGKLYSDTIKIDSFNKKWIMHPTEDLAILPFAPIKESFIRKYKKEISYTWFHKEMIPTINDSLRISSLEKVIMIGYPKTLWDSTNNLPVIRQGITATPYFTNFNGLPRFLIDIPTFQGSSGSPVLLYSFEPYWIDSITLRDEFRIYLLGIAVESYTYSTEGILIPNNFIPLMADSLDKKYKPKITLPLNIAIAIKADKLYDFQPLIKKYLLRNKP